MQEENLPIDLAEFDELEPIDEDLYVYPSPYEFRECSLMLRELPRLKTYVTRIDLYRCNVREIPALHEGIVSIRIWHNPIDIIHSFPSTLCELILYDCQLKQLPALSPSLITMNCANNYLEVIPELPSSLEALECHSNMLKCLPELPNRLKYLKCEFNKLVHIPRLPKSLTSLTCYYNHLVELPEIHYGMEYLCCENNRILTLPYLPESMRYLTCDNHLYSEDIKNSDGECMFPYCPNKIISDVESDSDHYETASDHYETEHTICFIHMLAQKRIQARTKLVKEGIMMKAWHPSRVSRLIELGIDVEDM